MIYHTQSHGVDAVAFAKGLLKAIDLAKAKGIDVIYFVPTLANLDSDAPDQVMGAGFGESLRKHRRAKIDDVEFFVETEKTRQTNGDAVLFALYPSNKGLAKAMADHRIKEVVYVPWSDVETEAHEKEHPSSTLL
jgi:hypothetical protein